VSESSRRKTLEQHKTMTTACAKIGRMLGGMNEEIKLVSDWKLISDC